MPGSSVRVSFPPGLHLDVVPNLYGSGSFRHSTQVTPLRDGDVDVMVMHGANNSGMSNVLGALDFLRAAIASMYTPESKPAEVGFSVVGESRTDRLFLAHALRQMRYVEAAHQSVDLVVQDELHAYDASTDDFRKTVRLLKKEWGNRVGRRKSGDAAYARKIVLVDADHEPELPSTEFGCAAESVLQDRCGRWLASMSQRGTGPGRERSGPSASASVRKLTRQVKRLFERAIAEADQVGRRDGRHYVPHLIRLLSPSPSDVAECPPLSRIITLFRTNLVGNLTRNAPPAAA